MEIPNFQTKISAILMGGATDFKVGVENRIRERSERKKNIFVPPLLQMWGYKQANISRGRRLCCSLPVPLAYEKYGLISAAYAVVKVVL